MSSSDRPIVARDVLLSQMLQRLDRSGRVVLGQPDSHPGSGRTALANQYADQHRDDYGHTFRLRCATETSFRGGLVDMAASLGLPERFVRQPGDPLSGVLLWLQSNDDWLLILDDVVVWESAARLMDPDLRGHIVVIPSTEAPAEIKIGEPLAVSRFTVEDAVAYLRPALGGTPHIDDRVSYELMEFCGRQALTLSLMAGALRGTQRDPAELLKELSQLFPKGETKTASGLLTAEDRFNYRIRQLVEFSVNQCGSLSPLAERLLRVCSFLDGERMPVTLLAMFLGPDVSADDESLRRSLSLLHDFSLLTLSATSGECTMHPRVQSALRARFKGTAERQKIMPSVLEALTTELVEEDDAQRDWQRQVTLHADVLCGQLSRSESPEQAARLLSVTADRCATIGATGRAISLSLAALNIHWAKSGEQNPLVADELERTADFYRQHQQFRHARRGYRQTLAILRSLPEVDLHRVLHLTMRMVETDLSESLLDHARTRLERAEIFLERLDDATSQQRGVLQSLQGSYLLGINRVEAAISTLEASLQTLTDVLPEDDSQLLKVRTVLGRAYFAAEQYDDAERILCEDVHIRDASASIGESDIAVPTNLLGELYLGQGRFVEAEPLFERVLRVREATLGTEHRLVGEVANRLAVVKGSRGDYAAAEPLFRRALSIHESLYGTHHPEVARVLNDLAEMLYAQTKHDPARRLLERALMIQQKRLRHTDMQLARTRNNLAAVYVAKGLYDEAEVQFQRDLDAKRKAKVVNRPGIATALNNLGDVWRAQGRYSGAEEAFRESLAIREEVLGGQHPLVAQSQSNLGYVLLQRRKIEPAAELFEKSLAIRERCLSPMHPHIAATLNNLGEVHLRLGHVDSARPLLERSLDICRTLYGEQNAQTAAVFSLLGKLEFQGGSRAKAELLLLKARGIQHLKLAPRHRHRARNAMSMAELYLVEGKRQEAEELLVGAVESLRDQPGNNPLEIADALFMLGRLYDLSDRQEMAEPLLQECLSNREQVLGSDHPDVAACLSELGSVLHHRGASRDAERLLTRAITICETAGMQDRGDTERDIHGETLGRLADVYCELKEPKRAEALLDEQQRMIEAAYGPDDERLAPVLSRLACVYYLLERYDDAAPLLVRSLEMTEAKFGPDSPETAKHIESLAGVYALQNRFEQAETLMLRSVHIVEEKYGPLHDDVAAALEKYADLLRRADRHHEADVQTERVEQIRGRTSHVLDDLF